MNGRMPLAFCHGRRRKARCRSRRARRQGCDRSRAGRSCDAPRARRSVSSPRAGVVFLSAFFLLKLEPGPPVRRHRATRRNGHRRRHRSAARSTPTTLVAVDGRAADGARDPRRARRRTASACASFRVRGTARRLWVVARRRRLGERRRSAPTSAACASSIDLPFATRSATSSPRIRARCSRRPRRCAPASRRTRSRRSAARPTVARHRQGRASTSSIPTPPTSSARSTSITPTRTPGRRHSPTAGITPQRRAADGLEQAPYRCDARRVATLTTQARGRRACGPRASIRSRVTTRRRGATLKALGPRGLHGRHDRRCPTPSSIWSGSTSPRGPGDAYALILGEHPQTTGTCCR